MHRLEQAHLARMDVAGSGHAEPTLEAGREVRHDVSEHVRGDDHLELPRLADHLKGQVVDVEVPGLDARVLGGHGLEDAQP